jgi:hypothetical protein
MSHDVILVATSESPLGGAYQAAITEGLRAAGAEPDAGGLTFSARGGATGRLKLVEGGARIAFEALSSGIASAVYEAAAASHSLILPAAGVAVAYRTVGETGKPSAEFAEVRLVAGASSLREALEAPVGPATAPPPAPPARPAVSAVPPTPRDPLGARVEAPRPQPMASALPRAPIVPAALRKVADTQDEAFARPDDHDPYDTADLRRQIDAWFPVGRRELVSPLSPAEVDRRLLIALTDQFEGSVGDGRLTLRRRDKRLFKTRRNELKSVIEGTFEPEGSGTRLRLRGGLDQGTGVMTVAGMGAVFVFIVFNFILADLGDGPGFGALFLLLAGGAIGWSLVNNLKKARAAQTEDQLWTLAELRRILQAHDAG